MTGKMTLVFDGDNIRCETDADDVTLADQMHALDVFCRNFDITEALLFTYIIAKRSGKLTGTVVDERAIKELYGKDGKQ